MNAYADRELFLSPKFPVAASVFAGILTALGILAIILRPSVAEAVFGAIVAVIGIFVTAMTWVRHRYALHSWGLLAGSMAVADLVLRDSGQHTVLYWFGKLGTACFLGWGAIMIFRFARRSGRSGSVSN